MRSYIKVRRVDGESMRPALKHGRVVIGVPASKLTVGSVVIAEVNNREIIKRVGKLRAREVFLLGDNQSCSTDSRNFGWISREQITAKVIWPRLT